MSERREEPTPIVPVRRGNPTLAVLSLGCRANQEEVECLLGTLCDRGFDLVPFGSPADWILINGCSVTVAGESDTRQAIRRAARVSGGRGKIIVTGCYAQKEPAQAAQIGADLVVGNSEKWRLPDLLATAAEDGRACAEILVGEDPTTHRFLQHGRASSGFRTRAAIKVQDGCDERCTYCIVPRLRGRGVSRDPEEVLAEARVLVSSGHPEVTLTGIHTASYRWEQVGLAGLLRRLLEVSGLMRIRLNSLGPQWIGPELIEVLASSPRFCRHLHLPLQSGDATILRLMGRGYTPQDYERTVTAVRERIPEVAIGADVMVGFPGEDEERFARTLRLLEETRPAYLHIFPYSERPGTAALRLPKRVEEREKRARAKRLACLDHDLRTHYLRRSEGEAHELLVEAKKDRDRRPQGLTDTAIRVSIDADPPAGSWVRVRLRWIGSARRMLGELCPASDSRGTR